jgi:hypothetical protein
MIMGTAWLIITPKLTQPRKRFPAINRLPMRALPAVLVSVPLP